MEVKVGIRDVAREVAVETKATAEEVQTELERALSAGGLFTLVDEKGRKVLVPAAQVAYVDLGAENVRTVGFGALNN